MSGHQDCLELDELQALDSISNEAFNDSEELVIESLEGFISLLDQDAPVEHAALESHLDAINQYMPDNGKMTVSVDDLGTESIVDTATGFLQRMVKAVVDFFKRVWRWLVSLFTRRNKTPKATADVVKEAKDLEKEIETAESVIAKSEKDIDDALHEKGKVANSEDAKQLAQELISNYNVAMTESQIKQLGSRTLVKDIIRKRVDAYTTERLSKMTNMMTHDQFQEFGLMASNMLDLLLKDYRTEVVQMTRKFNDAVVEFRKTSSLSDEVVDSIDSMSDQANRVIQQMLDGYMTPFGKHVNYGRRGTGVNMSSNTTIAKTLKFNVEGLIELLNASDAQTYSFTFNDTKKAVDSFLAISNRLGSDHAQEIEALLKAVEYSLTNLTEVIATYDNDTRKRNQKINKFFSSALMQLQAAAQIAREVTRVYNAYLDYSSRFVSTYVAIVGYHNRDIKTVLGYYMSITSGFKQRSLAQIGDKMTVGEASLVNAKASLKTLIEANQQKSNNTRKDFSTFDYAMERPPRRKKQSSGLARAQASRADQLGYDIKSYPYDTRGVRKKTSYIKK